MQERIKKLRKTLGLTQQEFADRIGIKRNTVATYEIGRNIPLDPVIKSICREFNVDETWLRTGDGEMFVQQGPEDEIAAAVDRLIIGKSADFKRRLVLALSSLKDEHWALLEQKLKELTGQQDVPPAAQAPAPPPAEPPPDPTQALVQELAELKRQNYQLSKLVAEQREEIDLIKSGGTTSESVKAAEAAYEKSLGIVPRRGSPAWSTADDMEAGEDVGTA